MATSVGVSGRLRRARQPKEKPSIGPSLYVTQIDIDPKFTENTVSAPGRNRFAEALDFVHASDKSPEEVFVTDRVRRRFERTGVCHPPKSVRRFAATISQWYSELGGDAQDRPFAKEK